MRDVGLPEGFFWLILLLENDGEMGFVCPAVFCCTSVFITVCVSAIYLSDTLLLLLVAMGVCVLICICVHTCVHI